LFLPSGKANLGRLTPIDTPQHGFETLPHIVARILNLTLSAHAIPAEESMMKAFTQHPHKQGVTYFEHWNFAMGIAWRLLASVTAFMLHAVLPFITIEPRLDLEATARFLAERNYFIETAAASAHQHSNQDISGSNVSGDNTPVPA
jgi:hypothetical protein